VLHPVSSGLSPLPLKIIEANPSPSPFAELGAKHPDPPAEPDRMKQLEQMLHEAQGRAEIIEKEAYGKAYLAGEKTGMELGRKRAEQIVSSMERLLRQSENELTQMHAHINEAVLDITEAVIHHVVGEMLNDHPGYLKQMVDQCTRRLPACGALKLAIAPEDMSIFETLLGNSLQENQSEENKSQEITLIPDGSVRPGACRIVARTNDVLIDPEAAITECMRHIRDELLMKQKPIQSTGIEDTANPS